MSSNGNIKTLHEAGVLLIDCEHKTPISQPSGYPYVTIPQIVNGRIDLTDVRYISQEDFVTWTKKANPQANDIILSRRCNPGETAYVPPNLECAVGQNLVLLRSDGETIYPPFLRWLVRGPEWWSQIKKFLNTGAVFDSLKCADVPNFELSIPPLPTQHRIAEILSALDDKIELNRQTNATLEAIAQTIFKEWFVNFNFPGATGEMVESELGMIPKGWRVGRLGDIVDVKGGSTPSTKEAKFWNGDYHWATPKDLANLLSPVLLNTERKITKEGVAQISSGILPKGTLLLSSRAPIGYLAITNIPIAINQGFIAINAMEMSTLFMLHWLKENMEKVVCRANGSTFLEISKTNFKSIDIIIPDLNVVRIFDENVNPIFENVMMFEKQTTTLAAIRDALLPKLMSGEIEV